MKVHPRLRPAVLAALALVMAVTALVMALPATGAAAEDVAGTGAGAAVSSGGQAPGLADAADGSAVVQPPNGSVDGGAPAPLRVVGAALLGSDSWSAWFGAAPSRTLVFVLENTGTTTITDPPVTLNVGRSANPTTDVAIPALGSLSPGERRRYEVPVTFDAFAVGSYSAAGRITVEGETLTFSASTTSYPWALIVIPLVVVLEVVLLRGRNRLRRAFQASSAPTSEMAFPPAVVEVAPEIDALVHAAIAGAFAAAAGPKGEEAPILPRDASPIDVRPIVTAIVGRRVEGGSPAARRGPGVGAAPGGPVGAESGASSSDPDPSAVSAVSVSSAQAGRGQGS